MKKQLTEPDFIGGQGPLTKEEELAISAFIQSKKTKRHTGSQLVRATGQRKSKQSA